MAHQEHTKFKLIDKVDPRRLGCSPATAMIVGAILNHDFGARNGRGQRITNLWVSEDGFVVVQTHDCNYEFIGTAYDLYQTLMGVLKRAELTPPERDEFTQMFESRILNFMN